MPCKIEIRKTIDNSIAVKTDNNFQGFSEKSARAIAVSLNKLWGSIATIAQSTGRGSYMVITSRLQEAVDREFDRQQKAEAEFERDLSFFNDDRALYEQEEKETQFQKQSKEGILASEKTLRYLSSKLSNRIGVPVKIIFDESQDFKGKLTDNVAVVNLAYATLDTPVHEIIAHPVIRAIRTTNPALYKNLLKELNSGKGKEVLNRIKESYGEDSGYDLEDQQEEAIVELLGMQTADKLDGKKDQGLIASLQKLLNEIKEFLKSLLGVDGVYVENLDENATIGDLVDLIANNESKIKIPKYDSLFAPGEEVLQQNQSSISQYTPAQAAIANKISADDESLTKVDRKSVDSKGKEIIKQIYVRTTGEGKKDVANRVTDIVRQRSKDKGFDEENLTTEERNYNAFKRDVGIDKHQMFEDIHGRYYDENGVKRTAPLSRPEFKSKEEEDVYIKLETYFVEKTDRFPEGTIFLAEKKLYDPTTDTAGTTDLIAIEKDGTTSILDWKFGTVSKDAEDIAWYKQDAYNVQLGQYKSMLSNIYGVTKFRELKAIPILLRIKSQNKKDGSVAHKLTGINIGSADPTKITSLLLTPISEQTESTGDAVVDEQIAKLNSLAERISNENSDEENYELKVERLNVIRKAVRLIQGQNNLSGIIDVIQTLRNQGARILDDYNAIYKDRPADSEDSTNKELSEFSRQMREYIDAADMFDRIEVQLGDRIYSDELAEDIEEDDEEGQAYLQELRDVLSDLTKQSGEIYLAKTEIKKIILEFADKHIGERNLVLGLTESEAIPKGLAAGFKEAVNFGVRSINIMAKLNTTARTAAKAAAEAGVDKLMNIRKRLVARGDTEQIIKKIFKKDQKGDTVNKLVNKYDPAFREAFRDNAASENKKWLEENIDLDRVRKESEPILNRKIARIESFYKNDEEKKENAILRVERIWDVDNPEFNGWKQNYLLQKYPQAKWYSQEYKAVLADPELKELYEYVEQLNQEAGAVGFIEKRIMDSFLPFVRKSVAEKVIEGNVFAPVQNFYNSLQMNPDDVGYGKFDEITGKLVNAIPKYYTYDFTRKADGPNDYSDVSFDLFANLILYTQEVEKYKYLTEIEDQISMLRTVEEFKTHHIATGRAGNIIMENNQPKLVRGNEDIIKDFDLFTRSLFYEQKYVMSDVDTPVGINKAVVNIKKLINKVAGKEIVSINEGDDRPTSLVKLMDAANRAFVLKTLSLDPLPGVVNLLGSQFQISAQSGNYFTAREVLKNEGILLGHRLFKSKDDREMFAQLINAFVPMKEDPSYEKFKKSSVVKGGMLLNGNNIGDFLMIAFRKPEQLVEKSIFLTLLDNSMIENGKIVNIRKFVKAKYNDRYDSSGSWEKSKGKIDAEIEQLKKTRSITNTMKLENGKLVIPGLDLNNKKELDRLSRLTKNTTNRAIGSVSQESITKMDMSIWTKSMMVFKKWIYPLLETRFSGIHKLGADDFDITIDSSGTLEGEQYDLGRANLFLGLMYDSIKEGQLNIKNILQVNESGVKKLDDLYEYYTQQYYKKTGQKLNMNKDDFKDMIRQNVQSSLKEISYIIALTAAAFALGMFAPDDDEDKATKNRHRYYLRTLDKIKDEITFFYNPNEIRNLAAGGIFPAIAVVTDALKFFTHLSEQITGMPISGKKDRTPEQVRKDAMPVKDFLKSFVPGGKTVLTFGAVLSEDWAKEFDITVQPKNTVR